METQLSQLASDAGANDHISKNLAINQALKNLD